MRPALAFFFVFFRPQLPVASDSIPGLARALAELTPDGSALSQEFPVLGLTLTF